MPAEDCQEIAETLGIDTEKDGCGFAKETRPYQGQDVTYITGRTYGNRYALTVSWGRH